MTSSIPELNNVNTAHRTPQAGSLLEVDNLRVSFVNGRAVTDAVRGVSFSLGCEKLAIVGESGSGKSTVGRAAAAASAQRPHHRRPAGF